jgi:hypothetical protein
MLRAKIIFSVLLTSCLVMAAPQSGGDFPRDKVIQALKTNVDAREKAQREIRDQYLELATKLEGLKPEAMGNYPRMVVRANDLLDRQVIASEEREIFQSLLSAAQEEMAYRSCREFLQKRLTQIIDKTFPSVEPLRPQDRRRLERLIGAKAAMVTASGDGINLIYWFAGYLRKTSRSHPVLDLDVLTDEANFENGVDSEKAKSATLEEAGDYVDKVMASPKESSRKLQ